MVLRWLEALLSCKLATLCAEPLMPSLLGGAREVLAQAADCCSQWGVIQGLMKQGPMASRIAMQPSSAGWAAEVLALSAPL
jgi:hypothetical protein